MNIVDILIMIHSYTHIIIFRYLYTHIYNNLILSFYPNGLMVDSKLRSDGVPTHTHVCMGVCVCIHIYVYVFN
jgi:hypothetical protein